MKFLILLVIAFLSQPEISSGGRKGDDDPYPTSCVDFSGNWTADDGVAYEIKQRRCSKLRIAQEIKGVADGKVAFIVPDGQFHAIKGKEWTGQVRHRWNSNKKANAIETYRYIYFNSYSVEEVVQLERVNDSMMLESTYRTVYSSGSEPKKDYNQKVFRKAKLE